MDGTDCATWARRREASPDTNQSPPAKEEAAEQAGHPLTAWPVSDPDHRSGRAAGLGVDMGM